MGAIGFISRVAFCSCLSLAACAAPSGFNLDGGDGSSDATAANDGSPCSAGQWECASPTQARQCDGRGGFSQTVDCAMSNRVCTNGVGCTTCRARDVRCNPNAAETPQTCADDGAQWIDGTVCDGANGEHCVNGRCTRPCDNLGDSYLGCEYWPTSTANGGLAPEMPFAVVVANTQPYPVDLLVEGGPLAIAMTATVAPGGTQVLRLPWITALSQNVGMCCGPPFNAEGLPLCTARSAQSATGAYHLRSNGPIAAYQFNPLEYRVGSRFSFTNDASLLLPQNTLGRHYLVFAFANTGNPFSAMTDRCTGTGIRGGYVTVVGAQSTGINSISVRTAVALWDPRDPTRTLPAGIHAFQLARGEALQLVAQGPTADLTGTYIESAEPIAVYSGHECAAVPVERPACDHLEEQLFPITAWGRTYAVSPLQYRMRTIDPSLLRVMAQRDGVNLTFDGIATPAGCERTLNRGQFCEFSTDQGFRVTGSGPIAVAQYMRGLGDVKACRCAGQNCPEGPECRGDPAMILVPPVDQYRSNYRFLVPDTYTDNFVNVLAPADAQIELDGNVLSGPTVPSGPDLITRFVTLTPGSHELRATDGTTRFGIVVYGVAPFTSYAYPGGLELAEISPP